MTAYHLGRWGRIEDRFEQSITFEPNTGCWLWLRSLNRNGYGVTTREGLRIAAHRLSWEMFHGPIPDGLWVLHKCDQPGCVNPDHLFVGTRSDNMLDCYRKGRAWNQQPGVDLSVIGKRKREQTHCKWGHLLSGYNSMVTRQGHLTVRQCRACHNRRRRATRVRARLRRSA